MEIDDKTITELYRIAKIIVKAFPKHFYVFDRADFIQIAVWAAVRDMPRFDPHKSKLTTFITHRMIGAIKDELRLYMGSRRPDTNYRDHTSARFSVVEQTVKEKSREEGRNGDLDWYCPDYRERAPEHNMEVWDRLLEWKAQNVIGPKQWEFLWWRFGIGLTQKETADLLGVCESRASQIETELRGQLGLCPLPRVSYPTPESAKVPFGEMR